MRKSLPVLLMSLLMSCPAWSLTITAVGDIMMGTDYPDGAGISERDFFQSARPFFSASDIRIGNLEGTLYDGEQNPDGKRGGKNRYLFRTPTRLARHLVDAGFNFLSLANNHSRDFGRNGLVSTKQTLAANDIGFSSKDGEVAEIEIGGERVAIISADYYAGARSITTPEALYREIRNLNSRYDIVIVVVHAGGEGMLATNTLKGKEIFLGENRGDSIGFARRAVDEGADLILMAGPHVPRGLEVYRDRLIAYSLGNFLTEKGISISGIQGLAPLLEVQIDHEGRFTGGNIHSFQQVRGRPVGLDMGKRAFRLMSRMSQEDFPESMPLFSSDGKGIAPRSAALAPLY